MNVHSIFQFWTPLLPLNTDMAPIHILKIPEMVTLLSTNFKALVKKRAVVQVGQKLTENLISPYSGEILSIETLQGLDLKKYLAISIKIHDTKGPIGKGHDGTDFTKVSREELVSLSKTVGIKTFPHNSYDRIVINCLDRDHLSAINQQIFLENGNSLKESLYCIKKITGCNRVVIALTKKLKNMMQNAIDSETEIMTVEPYYPNGLSEILLCRLFPKEKDHVKNLVIDMEYLLMMSKALKHGTPIQDKIVFLSVPQKSMQKNICVKIGTPMVEVFKELDIESAKGSKVIVNGPLSGSSWFDFDYPITEDIHSILVQDKGQVFLTENNYCLHCGKCVTACPLHLAVNLICQYAQFKIFDECQHLDVGSCLECGLCAYSCTARRPLMQYIHHAKVTLSQQKKEVVS